MVSRYLIYHWLIDTESGSLLHQKTAERRRLGEYQLKLLLALAENAGKILTREELTALVWERRVVGNNSLPNAIHALRTALNDDGKKQRIIKTIPRKGYILEAEYCRTLSPEEQERLAIADINAASLAKNPINVASQQRPPQRSLLRWLCVIQAIALLMLVVFFL